MALHQIDDSLAFHLDSGNTNTIDKAKIEKLQKEKGSILAAMIFEQYVDPKKLTIDATVIQQPNESIHHYSKNEVAVTVYDSTLSKGSFDTNTYLHFLRVPDKIENSLAARRYLNRYAITNESVQDYISRTIEEFISVGTALQHTPKDLSLIHI